jgi:2-oxoglutarate dehydrogenase E2 component (dihydrolipoamide succinyltransferase)
MAVEIKAPVLGESVSEATVAKWFRKEGETVALDELLVELETDKVSLEVTASVAGMLKKIVAPEGAVVHVSELLGVIEEGAAGTAPKIAEAAPPAAASIPVASAPVVTAAPTSAALPLAPSVRKMAAEQGLSSQDLAAIPATGKDGRLTKGDMLAPRSATPVATMATGTREERVRMSRLRKRIAERLKDAQNTAAILTTFNEIDMTNVIAMRNRYKESFEKKYGVKLGFMSFFLKAAIAALQELPAVNAEIDGDDLVYKHYYDIGVAVGTEQGLVVPVVRDADRLNFAGIEQTIADLGKKARDGKLSIEDLTGGTFTISNGGVYGSLLSTPILNPPQSGILGMHKTQERPVVVDGKIEIRPMMYVALSYDHRVIDGKEAVTFLVKVKEAIENPERLLLSL